jgi:hypothetical protein
MNETEKIKQLEFIRTFLKNGESEMRIFEKFRLKWPNTSQDYFNGLLTSVRPGMTDKTPLEGVLSRDERKLLLSQIARGEIAMVKTAFIDKVAQKVECYPDYTDRKNAISELNKMDGLCNPGESGSADNLIIVRAVRD